MAGPHTQFVQSFMEECVECLEQGSRGNILQFMPFTMVSYDLGGEETGSGSRSAGDKEGDEQLLHQTLLGSLWNFLLRYDKKTYRSGCWRKVASAAAAVVYEPTCPENHLKGSEPPSE